MTKKPTPAPIALRRAIRALALGLAITSASPLAAQVTPAFTYQGELRSGGNPANASFDMEFRLYGAATGGAQIGPVVTRPNVAAVNGLFNVQLDFGPAQFAGDRQWLEVRIKPAGSGSYETLLPRTEVTATPYALGAVAALANSVTTTSVVDGTLQAVDLAPGAVGATQIDSAQVQRRVSGSCNGSEGVQAIAADGSVSCGSFAGGSGTVTNVATGVGLTGGPITGSGTISVAPGGIGATEIDSAQVQRRVSGACAGANFVQQVNQDGSVGCGPAEAASGWSLNGNAGTDPSIDFLGTLDQQPLVLRAANAQSFRIEPSAEQFGGLPITANVISGSHANFVEPGVRGATIGGGGLPDGDSDPFYFGEAPHRVTDHYGTIGGGFANQAGDGTGSPTERGFATVSGGRRNIASGENSTVSGGFQNIAQSLNSTVGGGENNQATGSSSTVAGGGFNVASGLGSTIGGGAANQATAIAATISGGLENTAADFAVVGGGQSNQATQSHSAVGGGSANSARGERATIGGGAGNVARGLGSTIAGGEQNEVLGAYSTVGGGSRNCAATAYSWAGGRRAKVRHRLDLTGGNEEFRCRGVPGSDDLTAREHDGTFLWADSQDVDFLSGAHNQFAARASTGFWFGTHGNPPDAILMIPYLIETSTGASLTSGGVWTNASSRALKDSFEQVDPTQVLERLLELPVQRWRYIASPAEGVHLGPVAEDFHAAFGLGHTSTRIGTSDASGVAFAAIQGLNQKLEAENAALRAELAELRRMVEALAGER